MRNRSLAPRAALAVVALASLAACSSAEQVGKPVVPRVATTSAAATLVDPQGQPGGRATLTQVAGGVEIVVSVESLAPGEHGVHVHAVGRCEPAPDASTGQTVPFGAAGGHFDPGASQHHRGPGQAPTQGHAGDMPNLVVAADRTGTLRYVHPHASLGTGAQSVLGKAIVVHAQRDDYTTDPAGNSGGRVLCGVIEPARPTGAKPNQG
jgi:Cu-Zn family superoxide dismutase